MLHCSSRGNLTGAMHTILSWRTKAYMYNLLAEFGCMAAVLRLRMRALGTSRPMQSAGSNLFCTKFVWHVLVCL